MIPGGMDEIIRNFGLIIFGRYRCSTRRLKNEEAQLRASKRLVQKKIQTFCHDWTIIVTAIDSNNNSINSNVHLCR